MWWRRISRALRLVFAPMPPMGGPQGDPSAGGPPSSERVGWNPIFKGLFTKKKSCDSCGDGHHLGDGLKNAVGGFFSKAKAPPPPAPAQGGTLAFPNHTYLRSPRDWFMQDQ